MGAKRVASKLLQRLPPTRRVVAQRDRLATELRRYRTRWPPGHYYSPIPSLDEVRTEEDRIFEVPRSVPGIDLFPEAQLELVDALAQYHADIPFDRQPGNGLRYGFENDFFSYGDGVMLYCLLRHFRPARIVEVGSGYSSALMLDVNEHFLDGRTQCTFIDPDPARIERLLDADDGQRTRILRDRVQDVDPALFTSLESGDMLFIDSSHVAKIGADVNCLFFEVLPALAPGVLVHVHDIFYPFEYPPSWVYAGWLSNEAYVLRAFLMFNHAYRIVLWNSHLERFHAERVTSRLPLWGREHEAAPRGSIWLCRAGTA